MINTEKKLYIFLNVSDDEIEFDISPAGHLEKKSNNEFIYCTDFSNVKINKICVSLLKKTTSDSYLHITKVSVDDDQLNYFDSFSSYIANGKIKKTYGWLDEIGTCIIKVHASAVSQNLLLYLLKK
jgi:hypothetical protein